MGFDDLFEKGNGSREKKKKIDFDSFVEEIKLEPDIEEAALKLWAEAFKLRLWYFVLKQEPSEDFRSVVPFIGEVEKKGWFFAFTDGKRARKFAQRQKLIDVDGRAFIAAVVPLEASLWMSVYEKLGVHGLRFNEGEHGWYMPLSSLMPTYRYLRDNKKI